MEPIKQNGISAFQTEIRPASLELNFASQPVVQPSPVQDVISILERHLAEEDKKLHGRPYQQKITQESYVQFTDLLNVNNAGKEDSGRTDSVASSASGSKNGTDSKFKCVMVDKDGSPDWSKVLNLDKDIIREVLEKHGIKMGETSSKRPGTREQTHHKKLNKKKKSKSQKKTKSEVKCGQQLEKTINCTRCNKTFRLRRNLRDHMRYHDDRKFKCTYCEYVAVRQKELEYHLNSHTGNRPFVCDICNKGFGHPTVLSSHKKTHRGHTGAVTCEVCKMDFTQPHLLDRHMQTHSEERPHLCSFCSNNFKRLMDLRKHIKLYHTEVPVDDIVPKQPTTEGDHRCHQCERSFQTEAGLEQHQRRTHNSRKAAVLESVDNQTKQTYSCEQCSKVFHSIKVFTKHKVSHSLIRPYTCSTCGRSYKRQWELHKHKLIHSKQPLIPCTQCNAQFPGRINLRRHILRMHSSDVKKPVLKPFRCDTCNRPYARKAELDEHLNIHTGARPYVCDTCGKTFGFRSSLACHRKLHTDESAIQCDVCGKRFGSKIRMREHRVIHTGAKPFVCQHCGTCYRYPSNLRWHLNKAHKKGPCGGRPRPRKPAPTKIINSTTTDTPQSHTQTDMPQSQQILVPMELDQVQFQAEPELEQQLQQQQQHPILQVEHQAPLQDTMQVHYHTGEVHEFTTGPVHYGNAVVQDAPTAQLQSAPMSQQYNQDELMAVAQLVLQTSEGSRLIQTEDGSYVIETHA